jgi:hypothetical protein
MAVSGPGAFEINGRPVNIDLSKIRGIGGRHERFRPREASVPPALRLVFENPLRPGLNQLGRNVPPEAEPFRDRPLATRSTLSLVFVLMHRAASHQSARDLSGLMTRPRKPFTLKQSGDAAWADRKVAGNFLEERKRDKAGCERSAGRVGDEILGRI